MDITIYRKEFQQMNCLIAEAGSNCPQGGDAGAGGRTVLRFKDEGGTVLRAFVKTVTGESRAFDEVSEIELVFCGDSEHDTVLDALEFMHGILKATTDATSVTKSVN